MRGEAFRAGPRGRLRGPLDGRAASTPRLAVVLYALLAPLVLGAPPSPAVPGDLDGDGIVSVADYYVLARWLATGGPVSSAADVDGDGRAGLRDLQRLLGFLLEGEGWGAGVPVDPMPFSASPGRDNGGSDLEFVHFGFLARRTLEPGEGDVVAPIWLGSRGGVDGFRLSLRFDPAVIENVRLEFAAGVERRAVYASVYRERTAEGFIGAAALGPASPPGSAACGLSLPRHSHVADLVFDVRPDAGRRSAVTLAFAPMPGGPFANEISALGRLWRPREEVTLTLPIRRTAWPFVRGDVTGDGLLDVADAVAVFEYIFGDRSLPCPDAADIDDDGRIQFNDPIRILNVLFAGGPPPSPPYPTAGRDPSEDHLPPCRP